MPTVESLPVETILPDPSYLDGCQKMYPTRFDFQVGYEEIYPGKSKKHDLEQLVGAPDKIIEIDQKREEWIYNEADLGIFIEQNLVSEIIVFDSSKGFGSLEFYLQNYGCPNIIFIFDDNQHPSGSYDTLLIIYHEIGMTLMFESFPIQISDSPFGINYYPPVKLADFLSQREFFYDLNKAKRSFWSDVIDG